MGLLNDRWGIYNRQLDLWFLNVRRELIYNILLYDYEYFNLLIMPIQFKASKPNLIKAINIYYKYE